MPTPSLIGLHDYVTAAAIEHAIQYYIFFAAAGLLLNLARFFHTNVLTLDRKDEEVQTLKAQVENLHNVLEQVVKILSHRRSSYKQEEEQEQEQEQEEQEQEQEQEEQEEQEQEEEEQEQEQEEHKHKKDEEVTEPVEAKTE